MDLESASNQSSMVDSALETLRANRKYNQDKRSYGVERVRPHVEDVEGDWLENWSVSEPPPKSAQ
jgi:hypothetical protein